ncbi:hypothetical protein [Chakrabartyella piscis]|uniref:hypothetical protein n=1 Tax=Chakrabartyella piscis TaxID=2918914 RepID=UPI0029586DB7|nr:hypothetical protein [Chakrabartyella piscis]
MRLSEKGQALLKKYKLFQKLDVMAYVLAAMSFVFLGNIPLMIVIVVAVIVSEIKIYTCPHCKGGLDCRRRIKEDTVCPRCGKQIFKIH